MPPKDLFGIATGAQLAGKVYTIHQEFLKRVDGLKADIARLKQGPRGERGERGPKGEPGVTPKKGVHYLTPFEIKELTKAVAEEAGKYVVHGKDGRDGKDGKTPDEEQFMQKILKRIKTPEDGKDAIVDHDKLAEEVLKLIKDNKKLKKEDIFGLSEEISSYRQQMAWKQAGQHGGGDTVVAGSNITITANANGTKTIAATGGGTGDVTGPASATDNAIARFDGATGKIIQNSNTTIDDTTGNITAGTYNGNTIGAGVTSGTNTGDVTVTDSAEIDFTLAGQNITASIVAGSIDETKLDASVNASLDLADTSVQPTATQTLTNKRITRRLVTVNAPGATPTTNTDNVDIAKFTGLNTAITSMTTNLSGAPVEGDMLQFQFLDDGTARGITWGASFSATTVALPTTTVISTLLRVGFQWNGSTWACIATV